MKTIGELTGADKHTGRVMTRASKAAAGTANMAILRGENESEM